jgi:carboxypeptidase Taq
MNAAWDRLEPKLRELADLSSALKLLQWDQSVLMPPKGAPARARAVATIAAATHARLVDPALGDLIAELEADDSLDADRRASVRILRRDHDQATRVPEDLVRALAEVRGHAYQAWTEARPASDFSLLEPHLARLVDLKKQEADALGWQHERYDALLDQYEPGMTSSEVKEMFDELVEGLKPIVDAALGNVGQPPDFLSASFDPGKQMSFCRWLVETLGFEVGAGRLDSSPHPFTIQIGRGDVRQTTRTDEQDLLFSVYAAMHETGHALYEQHIPESMTDLPVGRYPSLGIHESQSRLWENQVGRSRPFCDFLLPKLKERFPEELGMVAPDDFYRGVNHPQRTLVRVSADELTYNLHVALRFELELALLRDELAVSDLPEAWDSGMEKYVGIRPDDHADGVLQDMHWSIGALGYFPTYSLGTIYSAAFFATAGEELGGLEDELESGDTTRLLAWLSDNIHSQGYRLEAKELAEKVTGGPVTARPLLDYLAAKYSDLYGASAPSTWSGESDPTRIT